MSAIKVWVGSVCCFVAVITGVAAFGSSTADEVRAERRISAEFDVQTFAQKVAAIDEAKQRAFRELERARDEAQRRHEWNVRAAGIRSKVSRYGISWPHLNQITSHFGRRRSGFHHGTDILCSEFGGEPIYAAADGHVITAGTLPIYGRAAVIRHSGATKTLYAHMWSVQVKAGQYVRRGQIIGTCGSTGNSTGPHLHFEFYRNGTPVNPLHHLPAWD